MTGCILSNVNTPSITPVIGQPQNESSQTIYQNNNNVSNKPTAGRRQRVREEGDGLPPLTSQPGLPSIRNSAPSSYFWVRSLIRLHAPSPGLGGDAMEELVSIQHSKGSQERLKMAVKSHWTSAG